MSNLVKMTIRSIGEEVLQSAAAFDKIIDVMEAEILPEKTTTAWTAWDTLEDMQREEGESTEIFVQRFKTTYLEVQAHDPDANVSARTLTRMMIKRLLISQTDRALLLALMEDALTAQALIDAAKKGFIGDLPRIKTKNSSAASHDSAFNASDVSSFQFHFLSFFTVF